MWAKCGFVFIIAGLVFLPAAARGEATIHWQTTLDSAKRVAGQSNQLVLVHFWAPWCGMCRKMEQDVFPQAAVVAAIEANYVPVKLNTDYFPATARQYGIHALPTDIIITPQGQLIQKQEGMLAAPDYVNLLGRTAASFRSRSPAVVAQIAPNQPPSNSANPPQVYNNINTTAGGAQNPAGPALPGMTPGGYWPQPGNPPIAAATTPNGPAVNSPGAMFGPAGLPGPSPQTAISSGPASAPPPGGSAGLPAPANGAGTAFQWSRPKATVPPGPALQANPPTQQTAVSAMTPPGGAPGYSLPGPGLPPPATAAAPAADARPGYALAGGPSSAAVAPTNPVIPKPAKAVPELPQGAPPLGLDGYCPVRLNETQRWVRGDPRWGVIHRGRTYLFSGPNEQRRFLADPDAFAPVMSGNDIVIRVERNEQIAGHREHGVFCDGKIYLFVSEESLQKFNRAPARYIAEVQQVLRPTSVQR
jgi:YHS domain-containing protein/thiol-disulfide isomerase/thioredoxin